MSESDSFGQQGHEPIFPDTRAIVLEAFLDIERRLARKTRRFGPTSCDTDPPVTHEALSRERTPVFSASRLTCYRDQNKSRRNGEV